MAKARNGNTYEWKVKCGAVGGGGGGVPGPTTEWPRKRPLPERPVQPLLLIVAPCLGCVGWWWDRICSLSLAITYGNTNMHTS